MVAQGWKHREFISRVILLNCQYHLGSILLQREEGWVSPVRYSSRVSATSVLAPGGLIGTLSSAPGRKARAFCRGQKEK